MPALRLALPASLRVPWGVGAAMVVYLGAWILLPVVAVLLLRVTAPFDPIAAAFIAGLRENRIEASFALALIDAIGGFIIMFAFLRRYRVSWATLGWRKFDIWQASGYFLAAFLLFVVLTHVILRLVSLIDPSFDAGQAQQNEFIEAATSHPVLALIALVVIPPIIEETVFRGFVFPAIAKRWGFWVGAVSSSLLFGVAHLQANVSVYTFILGILLCIMYVRLKSILPGIGLHMLNNYLAFIAITRV